MAATDHAKQLARAAAEGVADKIATTIVGLDMSGQMPLTDIFVIVSASSDRQVAAIVDEVEERVRLAGAKVKRTEGGREGRWVLLDFGDIVVHVFHEDEHHFYDLERLWRDCPVLDLGVTGSEQAALGGSAQGGRDQSGDEQAGEPGAGQPGEGEQGGRERTAGAAAPAAE